MPYILRIFGMGMPHILGYFAGGAKNWGCRISYDTCHSYLAYHAGPGYASQLH